MATLFAGSASAGILYSTNPAADALNDVVFSSGPFTGIGDSIVLTGAGVANTAAVEFFNDGSAGTFNASLTFFNAGTPVGSEIGSAYNLTGLSIGSNSELDATFQLGSLTLPQDVVFLLEVSGLSAGVDPGVELDSDPTLAGSNTADTAIVLQGGTYSQEATGGGNPYFELTSATVPEPSSWLLIGSGLLGALALRKRQHS
jgi:hypothetical protein